MVVIPRVELDTDLSEGLCFGCGRNNPIGLKLKFIKDGDTCRAEFKPEKVHQGWPGVVHGGILACMLDEAMSYAAHFEGFTCLTASMHIRLRQPVRVEESLVITAAVIRNRKKLIDTIAEVCLKDGTVVAESTAKQFIVENDRGHAGKRKESRIDA
jgi:acyl-coenzyme A thioesterase PaaI-like protein